jgi:hypothetical protein
MPPTLTSFRKQMRLGQSTVTVSNFRKERRIDTCRYSVLIQPYMAMDPSLHHEEDS